MYPLLVRGGEQTAQVSKAPERLNQPSRQFSMTSLRRVEDKVQAQDLSMKFKHKMSQ